MASTVEDAQGRAPLELLMIKRTLTPLGDRRPPERMFLAYAMFFMMGVGLASAYSSILFQSAFFVCLGYDPKNFISIVFASFNIPALPVFMLQSRFDRMFDLKFGTGPAVAFRVCLAQLVMVIPVLIVPYISQNDGALIITMLLCGAANGASYGALTGLASSFTPKCVAFLLMGTGSSTFFLLIVSQGVGDLCGANGTDKGARDVFFIFAAALTLLNIVWLRLLLTSEVGEFYVDKRDAEAQRPGASRKQTKEAPLLDDMDTPEFPEETFKEAEDSSITGIGKKAVVPILLAFAVYVPQYIAYPLYGSFLGQGSFMEKNIFYVDAIAGFFGRQLVLFRKGRILRTHMTVLIFAIVRSIAGIAFFFSIAANKTVVNQGLFLVIFVLWGVSNGFLGTLPYGFASSYFKSDEVKARSSLVLNIAATLCTYLSAIVNFTVTPACCIHSS